jgi:hypothetical protein
VPRVPCVLPQRAGSHRLGAAEEEDIVAVSNTPEDVAARDDAHLRSLGIQPELKRSLGFLANFALAFSFISVSTGSLGNFGIGLGLGGPVMFWTWPIIVLGQTLVALVFAELACSRSAARSSRCCRHGRCSNRSSDSCS